MHGIYIPDDDLFLPLRMHGVISYLSTYLPTEKQMETCRWIVMSSEEEWIPYDDKYAENERDYYNSERDVTEGENFDSSGNRVITGESSSRRNPINPVHLGRRWGISESQAALTLQAITTRAIRNYPQEEFSRRFRTWQAQLWMKALRKEMNSVIIAFEPQPEGETHVPGYKTIPGFIIWDVKIDFTRKARCIVGGHTRTEPPKALAYPSGVPLESVRLALLIAGCVLGVCIVFCR
jgi:hypothetical protein